MNTEQMEVCSVYCKYIVFKRLLIPVNAITFSNANNRSNICNAWLTVTIELNPKYKILCFWWRHAVLHVIILDCRARPFMPFKTINSMCNILAVVIRSFAWQLVCFSAFAFKIMYAARAAMCVYVLQAGSIWAQYRANNG